jgi:hypothetical protein
MIDVETKPTYLLVDYSRRSYAFGLPWFSSDEEEPTKKQAISLIKRVQRNYDLIGERGGDYPQYTVASSEEGMKAGAISAASIVAEMVPTDNWLYVAEIEGAYWITCGRDGLIMPEGDKVYVTEAEARQAFEDLQPARWKTVSVPSSWRDSLHSKSEGVALITSDIEESVLSDIFQKPSKTTARLSAVSSTATILKAFFGILLLGTVAYFAYSILLPKDTGPTLEESQRMAEEIARTQQEEQEKIYAQLDSEKPWELAPHSNELITLCLESIKGLPLVPAGYQLTQAECISGTTTGTYARNTSYPNWLREWAQTNPEFQIDISVETSDAFISQEFEAPLERGPENLTDYLTMLRTITETDLLVDGELTYTQPIQFTYDEYPEYIPIYGTSDLSIVTTQPEQWKLALERLPGIKIDKVAVSIEQMSYTLSGQIYISNR